MSNLSIKLTTPHQSDAPFVGERVFQNRGVCGKRSLLSPPAPPSLVLFALAPFSARPECENSFSRPDISFGSYGNACYAGKIILESSYSIFHQKDKSLQNNMILTMWPPTDWMQFLYLLYFCHWMAFWKWHDYTFLAVFANYSYMYSIE